MYIFFYIAGAAVVDVTGGFAVGRVGRVIGNIAGLEREFNVSLKIDGATARSSRILPAMNADIDGALCAKRARIEAMDPKAHQRAEASLTGRFFPPKNARGPKSPSVARQKRSAPKGPQKRSAQKGPKSAAPKSAPKSA